VTFIHQNGHWYSTVNQIWLANNFSTDVGMLHSWSGYTQTPANAFFETSTYFPTVTSTYSNVSQVVGAALCKSAAYSGYFCGFITQVDQTIIETIGGVDYHLTHQWQFGGYSNDGDSGGLLFANHAAAGIIVSKAGSSTWYTTMGHVITDTGFRPCYVSTYPC
jgi:hypothetical protein